MTPKKLFLVIYGSRLGGSACVVPVDAAGKNEALNGAKNAMELKGKHLNRYAFPCALELNEENLFSVLDIHQHHD